MSTITSKRGDTLRITFNCKTSGGLVYDLTGVSFRMEIRDTARKLVASVSSVSGIVTDTVAGTVTATFTPDVTVDFELEQHYTDLELTFLSGDVFSSDTITLNIIEDMTI